MSSTEQEEPEDVSKSQWRSGKMSIYGRNDLDEQLDFENRFAMGLNRQVFAASPLGTDSVFTERARAHYLSEFKLLRGQRDLVVDLSLYTGWPEGLQFQRLTLIRYLCRERHVFGVPPNRPFRKNCRVRKFGFQHIVCHPGDNSTTEDNRLQDIVSFINWYDNTRAELLFIYHVLVSKGMYVPKSVTTFLFNTTFPLNYSSFKVISRMFWQCRQCFQCSWYPPRASTTAICIAGGPEIAKAVVQYMFPGDSSWNEFNKPNPDELR